MLGVTSPLQVFEYFEFEKEIAKLDESNRLYLLPTLVKAFHHQNPRKGGGQSF
jgi:hypothetical protein